MIERDLKKFVSVLLAVAMVVTMLPMTLKETYAATGYDRGYAGGRYGNSTGTVVAEGLDISSWQGSSFDFQNVKNAGYDYVILRCGTTKGKDSCFESNYTKAKAAGLDVGAYYYSYATTVAASKSDAENCLSWISGKKFEYPIYFDYEDASQESLSTTMAKNICLTFMDMVADKGYLVGMYTGQYKSTVIPTDEICARYEFWVAHYYNDGLHASRDKAKAAISGMYQYTDSKYVNGVGPLDANVCYKDYPTIVKTYGFNGYYVDPEPLPTAKADHLSDTFTAKITYPTADKVLSIYSKYDIKLHTVSDSDAQRWKFEKQSDGTYKITNVGYAQCLSVLDSSSASGANIQLLDDDGSKGQRWNILYLGDDKYVLQPACSTDTVMTVAGGGTEAGTNIETGTYYAMESQAFGLEAILPTDVADLGESFKANITFAKADKNLSVYAENDVYDVKICTKSDGEEQQWLFEKQTDGTYMITNAKYQQCMMADSGLCADRTNVLLGATDGSASQFWTLLNLGNGSYIFRPSCGTSSSSVLDVYGGNVDDGTNIWIYTYNGSRAQEFVINKIETVEETTQESSSETEVSSSETVTENDTTEKSEETTTEKVTDESEKDTSEKVTEESEETTTEKVTDESEKDTSEKVTEESEETTTEKVTDESEKDTSEKVTEESEETTTEKVTDESEKDTSEKVTEESEETTTEKVTNESEKETTKETDEDVTNESEETSTKDSEENETKPSEEETTEDTKEEQIDLKAEAKKMKILNFKQLTYEYGTTAVSMSWSKVKNADGYVIYRATTKNGSYKYLNTVSSTSYRDRGLKGGSKYYYKVRAFRIIQNQKVYGPYPEAKRMITKPDTPTSFTVTAAGKKTVKLKWIKPSTTNGYEIYMSTKRNSSYQTIKSLDSLRTSYTKKGLVKGKKYYFKLRAFRLDASGKKVYSGYSQIKAVIVK